MAALRRLGPALTAIALLVAACGVLIEPEEAAIPAGPPVHPCDRFVAVAREFDLIARAASVEWRTAGVVDTLLRYAPRMGELYESLPAGGGSVGEQLRGVYGDFALAAVFAAESNEAEALEKALLWRAVSDRGVANIFAQDCG